MQIRLKYLRPIAPQAQLVIRTGYPVLIDKVVIKRKEDEYGASYEQEELERVVAPYIMLDKVKTIELPLCPENMEAIEKLTTSMFGFADSLSADLFQKEFEKAKGLPAIEPVQEPKKVIKVQKEVIKDTEL